MNTTLGFTWKKKCNFSLKWDYAKNCRDKVEIVKSKKNISLYKYIETARPYIRKKSIKKR